MEQGGQSSQNSPNQEKNSTETRTSSPATHITISKIERRRSLQSGARSFFLDNTCTGYGWLLPGWVAEERHMLSGRVYRYYYDPSGRQYKSQQEVIHAWEQIGIVVIDKKKGRVLKLKTKNKT